MADLLIRAEMPRVCANCFACKYDRDSGLSACNISGCVLMFDARLKRDKDCPLVELPDHGRLIDADALQNRLENSSFYEAALAADAVRSAQTIIPASKEGGA